ncbi:MAG: hypothetical protein NY202_01080 [Mollicutes bacterium UO1]
MLAKIKELIVNKPLDASSQEIALSNQNKQIIEKDKIIKELRNITSFHELESFRQEVIKKEIGKEKEQRNKTENLNILLFVLVISSLLTIVFLIIKMNKDKMENKKLRKE